jgi:hypothetical protein
MVPTDMQIIIEELLEAVFSVRYLPRLHIEGQLPVEDESRVETAVRRVEN